MSEPNLKSRADAVLATQSSPWRPVRSPKEGLSFAKERVAGSGCYGFKRGRGGKGLGEQEAQEGALMKTGRPCLVCLVRMTDGPLEVGGLLFFPLG